MKFDTCEKCENIIEGKCSSCLHCGNLYYQYPCYCCKDNDRWNAGENYCSRCGRPLTKRAEKILKERIVEMVKNNEI